MNAQKLRGHRPDFDNVDRLYVESSESQHGDVDLAASGVLPVDPSEGL